MEKMETSDQESADGTQTKDGGSLNDEWAAFEKLISADTAPSAPAGVQPPQMIQYPSTSMYAQQVQPSESSESESEEEKTSRTSDKKQDSDSDSSSDNEQEKEKSKSPKSEKSASVPSSEEEDEKEEKTSEKHSESDRSVSPEPEKSSRRHRDDSPRHRRRRSRDRFGRERRDTRDHHRRRHSPKHREEKSHRRKRSRSRDRHHSRHHRRRSGSPRHKRRRSRSGDWHRDRSRRSGHRPHAGHKGRNRRASSSRSRSRSPPPKREKSPDKPLNFKDKLKQQLIEVQKTVGTSIDSNKLREILTKSGSAPDAKTSNLPLQSDNPLLSMALNSEGKVTPQQAVLAQMAAMHQKAQELTGVAVPKYYNPAAVNPLKYAEQIQKRKLLWSKAKEPKEAEPEQGNINKKLWQSTSFGGGKTDEKFRKLMGIKEGENPLDDSEVTQEQIRKQQELFENLDKEYAFARMTTHTHRGMGLGIVSTTYHVPTTAANSSANGQSSSTQPSASVPKPE